MDKIENKEEIKEMIMDMLTEREEREAKILQERNGQPLSKREFAEILNHLKQEDETWDRINEEVDKLNPDFKSYLYPHSLNHTIIIKLLSLLFDLEDNGYGNDIEYFIYELEWGTRAEEFTFEDKGKNWVLKTPEDLYDYLVYEEK